MHTQFIVLDSLFGFFGQMIIKKIYKDIICLSLAIFIFLNIFSMVNVQLLPYQKTLLSGFLFFSFKSIIKWNKKQIH